MAWIMFVGTDLRDRDRLERGAAGAGLEVRPYSQGSWDAEDPPRFVVIDLDRQAIPAPLPDGIRAIGYYSHIDDALAEEARRRGVEPIPRGKFWTGVSELLRNA